MTHEKTRHWSDVPPTETAWFLLPSLLTIRESHQ
jgi:hypothetical protein